MDKSRDVRRVGASRFSPVKSGLDGGDGNSVVSEKLKKERVKRFTSVGRLGSSKEDGEMGSDEEDEFRPTTSISKRFKLPKKFFDDCNTVDHASVPRKLRSAKKKPSHKSVSPPLADSRKLNHKVNGVELLRKNGMKKYKLNVRRGDSEGSSGWAIVGPITKDEEEVVETLYALAGMFPDTDNKDKTKLDGEFSESKFVALPESENSMVAFEVPKKEEDSKIICPTATAEATKQSLNLECSAGETVRVQSLNEASQPDLPISKQLPMELDIYDPQVNLATMSLPEPTSERLSCNAVVYNASSELRIGTGPKQTKHFGALESAGKPEIALGPVAPFRSQHELQSAIKERKNNGPALWPGLSSTGSLGAETRGLSLQSSAAKLPAWLGNAICATQPWSSESDSLTEKDSRVPIDGKKSWKRCSAHVYISRLIKVLQITEGKDRLPMQPTQLSTDEGSKQEALLAANLLPRVMNGVVFTNSIACSATEKNPNEIRNAILLHKRLLQDQQQASTTSGLYISQKQSFDFLSASAGGCGVEANCSTSRAGSGLEPSTQFRVPYLHSLPQNHTIMPFSLPQNRYSSTSFPDHLSATAMQQVQIQLPPYLCGPFSGPHLATTVLPKQQQQRIWTTQLPTQYRPGEVAAAHLPNWQNGIQDSPSLIQYAQAIRPSYGSSLEALGPKFTPILPQQQQQLNSVTSLLPSTRVKRQHHHLPSGYEANAGVFRPDSASPLQLLCNEHL